MNPVNMDYWNLPSNGSNVSSKPSVSCCSDGFVGKDTVGWVAIEIAGTFCWSNYVICFSFQLDKWKLPGISMNTSSSSTNLGSVKSMFRSVCSASVKGSTSESLGYALLPSWLTMISPGLKCWLQINRTRLSFSLRSLRFGRCVWILSYHWFTLIRGNRRIVK